MKRHLTEIEKPMIMLLAGEMLDLLTWNLLGKHHPAIVAPEFAAKGQVKVLKL